MTRRGARALQVARLPVRLTTGETVQVVAQLMFNGTGALEDLAAVLPPPDRVSAAETAGVQLVQAVAAKLRNRPGVGVVEMRRRAEAALALLEVLEVLEEQHAPDAMACLRPAA